MNTSPASATTAHKVRRVQVPTLDVSNPPPMIDRTDGAALLYAKLGIKASRRTLEGWPVPTRHVNGRAMMNTEALLAHGRKVIEAGTEQRGGRGRGRRCFVQRQDAA